MDGMQGITQEQFNELIRQGKVQAAVLPPPPALTKMLSMQCQLEAEQIECPECRRDMMKLSSLLGEAHKIFTAIETRHNS